jgi:endonuclease G
MKGRKMQFKKIFSIIFAVFFCVCCYGQEAKDGNKYKDIVYEAGYAHNKWGITPADHVFTFRAYTTSFDGEDDNDGDGVGDKWGVPEWVAFEVRRKTMQVKASRPSTWMSEETLYAPGKNIAPKDDSYHFTNATKAAYPYSLTYNLSRGHMCPKNTANRLGKDADYNTHTVLNACPQKQWFNNGIWKDLERLTENWADEYGTVWVICGPVFHKKKPRLWLGETEKGGCCSGRLL